MNRVPIICGYTDLAPETHAVLSKYYMRYMDGPAGARGAYLSRKMTTDTDYMQYLSDIWRRGTGLLVVEHDIVPTIEQIEELQQCPEDWCAFPYQYGNFGMYAGLGCARFSAALTKHLPHIVQHAMKREDAIHCQGHWCSADAAISGQLTSNGATKHVHEGEVIHLRPYVSHGCTS